MAHAPFHQGSAARLTATVFALLVALAGLPSAADAAGPAEPAPRSSTVTGACGAATITVVPAPWPGVAVIGLRVGSNWGPILTASWTVRWHNATSGQAGWYSGGQLVLGDTFARRDTLWTGRGLVTVSVVSLEVVLWWGARCRGLGPLDQAWIP